MIKEAVACALGDLRLEAVNDLPLVLKQRKIGEEAALLLVVEGEVHMTGTDVAGSRLKEHGLVEAAPYVLGRVHQVLDPAGDSVDPDGIRVGGGVGG